MDTVSLSVRKAALWCCVALFALVANRATAADELWTSTYSACGAGAATTIYERSQGGLTSKCTASWPGTEGSGVARTTMTITGCSATTSSTNGSGVVQTLSQTFFCTMTRYKTQNGAPLAGWNPDTSGVNLTRKTCTAANAELNYWKTGEDNGCSLNACQNTTEVIATGPLAGAGTGAPSCINGCTVAPVAGTDNGAQISISFDGGSTVAASGIGSASSQWKRTGASCTGTGSASSASTAASGPNYASVGGSAGSQCGTFNGEYFCVGPPGSLGGGCVTTAGGQAFCTAAAAAPPAPKNPTTGAKASPDTTIQTAGGNAGTQTVNHYNSTTVVNGSAGGTSGGTGGSTGGTSGGTSGGTTGGTTGGTSGGISGGADCLVEPICDGDPVQCYIAKQTWRDSCNANQEIGGGTSCDLPPLCSGDPIGCYQAELQWKQACATRPATQQEATDAFAAGLGVESVGQGSMLPVHDTVSADGWFAEVAATATGGMCLPDIVIDLPQVHSSVTIPLTHACSIVRLLHALVLIGAAFVSFRIYMEGFN